MPLREGRLIDRVDAEELAKRIGRGKRPVEVCADECAVEDGLTTLKGVRRRARRCIDDLPKED